MKQRSTIRSVMSIATIVVFMLALSAFAGVSQRQSVKKTSFSESELRALAKSAPDVKNAGQLSEIPNGE